MKNSIISRQKGSLLKKRTSEQISFRHNTWNDVASAYYPQVKRYALTNILTERDIKKNLYNSRTMLQSQEKL